MLVKIPSWMFLFMEFKMILSCYLSLRTYLDLVEHQMTSFYHRGSWSSSISESVRLYVCQYFWWYLFQIPLFQKTLTIFLRTTSSPFNCDLTFTAPTLLSPIPSDFIFQNRYIYSTCKSVIWRKNSLELKYVIKFLNLFLKLTILELLLHCYYVYK